MGKAAPLVFVLPGAGRMLSCLRPAHQLPIHRFICRSAAAADMERYREAFARRMAMAGIKPHHRIALGVSGGPDSMALCVLTAGWKSSDVMGKGEGSGLVDGLLGIVVDHRLRPESTDEANLVCERLLKMGIQCKIASCDWSDGRPKQGRLQEAAREMRYQLFQDVCMEHRIGVLLVAHHADDQAELFILRLSRNSGVLGLAGMAFVSQLFPTHLHYHGENSSSSALILVRPLLNFSKSDMYKICQGSFQEWVEDPSNQSLLFARNRIRTSLKNTASDMVSSELQALISACRLTRTYIEQTSSNLIQQSVIVTDHGCAIIDLNKLNPSNIEDVCLSKFLAVILQFVSQRHRPVRGGVSNMLMDYIRNIPCQASLTAAGCYLCPVPKSKGAKILITVSLDSPQPLGGEIIQKHSCNWPCLLNEIDDIIMAGKLYSDKSFDASDVPFLKANSSEAVLKEAKEVGIICESTYNRIFSLQMEELKKFNAKRELKLDVEARCKMRSASISGIELHPGKSCHFMSRFLVAWKSCEKVVEDRVPSSELDCNSEEEIRHNACGSCMIGQEVASVRHMVDTDWMYLTSISKSRRPEYEDAPFFSPAEMEKRAATGCCSNYAQLSAQGALDILKSIPLPARRSLPVLVDSQDLPLCIPSINFQRCPELSAIARLEPRVPLGGGYSSYL